jgi:hypothetical protein
MHNPRIDPVMRHLALSYQHISPLGARIIIPKTSPLETLGKVCLREDCCN